METFLGPFLIGDVYFGVVSSLRHDGDVDDDTYDQRYHLERSQFSSV